MKVEGVELGKFTCHERTSVRLPERGLVVITGSNGSGKSSLLEGVAWAVWGRTVRGTNPLPKGGGVSFVAVDGGAVRVRRERKGVKGKASLVWTKGDVAPTEWETPTKAQDALEGVVGDYERWRRTCVFTSVDAWGFADAPDSQRKLLLEQLLGLGCFDEALARCRLDRSAAQSAEASAAMRAREAQVRADERTRAAGQLVGVVPDAPAPEVVAALEDRCAKLRTMLDDATQERASIVAQGQALQADITDANARVKVLGEKLAGLARRSECMTCGQPIGAALVKATEAQVHEAIAAAKELERGREDEKTRLRDAVKELDTEMGNMRITLSEADAHLRDARAAAVRAAKHAATVAAALADAAAAQAAVQALADAHVAAQSKVAVLTHTESVLGLRGVRAQVLDGALRAVEEVSNVWLARVASAGMALHLSMDGDKIALEVDGAGDGNGYLAASAGERRRIALALMLALAEVAQASAGEMGGTLWFDEVFDVLDDEGVAAVCDALRELAEERCVVVITHSWPVLEHMPEAAHLRVSGGVSTWLRNAPDEVAQPAV